MRLSWIVTALVAAAAVGGGVYYVTTKVEVNVPEPTAPATSSAPRALPDTHGNLETARRMKFPHQEGGPASGDGARAPLSAAFGDSNKPVQLPDAAKKSAEPSPDPDGHGRK